MLSTNRTSDLIAPSTISSVHSSKEQTISWENVTDEIALRFFKELSIPSVLSLGMTNRQFHRISQDTAIWKPLVENRFLFGFEQLRRQEKDLYQVNFYQFYSSLIKQKQLIKACLESGECVFEPLLESPEHICSFDVYNKELAIGLKNGMVKIFDIKTLKELDAFMCYELNLDLDEFEMDPYEIYQIQLNDHFLCAGCLFLGEMVIKIFDRNTKQVIELEEVEEVNEQYCCEFQLIDGLFYTGKGRYCHVFDLNQRGKKIQSYESPNGHLVSLRVQRSTLVCTFVSNLLFRSKSTIHVFDLMSRECLYRFKKGGDFNPILSDNQTCLSTSVFSNLSITDFQDQILYRSDWRCYSLREDDYFVYAGSDHKLQIFDREDQIPNQFFSIKIPNPDLSELPLPILGLPQREQIDDIRRHENEIYVHTWLGKLYKFCLIPTPVELEFPKKIEEEKEILDGK